MKKLKNTFQILIFMIAGLGLIGCGEDVADILQGCRFEANEEYIGSSEIDCIHSFSVGSPAFQVGDFADSVRFSADSTKVYALSSLVQEWDVISGEEIDPCQEDECFNHNLNQNGRIHMDSEDGFIGFSYHGGVYLGNTEAAELLYQSTLYQTGDLTEEAYLDAVDLFASYNTQTIHFYDRRTGQFSFDLDLDPLEINDVIAKRDRYAVSFSNDNRVFIFSTNESQEGIVLDDFEGRVVQMKFSPDATLLATVEQDGTLSLWEISSGAQLFQQFYEPDELFSDVIGDEYEPNIEMAISSDNQLLAARGDTDRTVSFFSINSGEIVAEYEAHSLVYEMTFSPDGVYFATVNATTGQFDGNVRSCIGATGRRIPNCVSGETLNNGNVLVFDISGVAP